VPLRRFRPGLVHPPGLVESILDRIRGREQKLVRAAEEMPLLLISHPKDCEEAAAAVEAVYARVYQALSPAVRAHYQSIFRLLPTVVVVVLRRRNPCGCLGHHHPRGTESRLTRRLAADLGSTVGEIDLAYEGIRAWRPRPISSMALDELGLPEKSFHEQAAVLAVLLHELEHLALPNNEERDVRTRSNDFYRAVMEELAAGEVGSY
jgi:hypothetical protein